MTLGKLLNWMDAACPSAYTQEQKAAWVSDLEAVIWTQIFLQPMGLWRPYTPEEDGRTRLLLPEGWRRIYTAWLGAMIDFANGEYNRYENSMSLYNGYIAELGAWYADAFAPAQNPAQWVDLGTHDYADLTGEGRYVGALPPDEAILCVRHEPDGADGGELRLSVGKAGGMLQEVYITNTAANPCMALGLTADAGAGEKLYLSYTGIEEPKGSVRTQVLIQPSASQNSLHNGGTLWRRYGM